MTTQRDDDRREAKERYGKLDNARDVLVREAFMDGAEYGRSTACSGLAMVRYDKLLSFLYEFENRSRMMDSDEYDALRNAIAAHVENAPLTESERELRERMKVFAAQTGSSVVRDALEALLEGGRGG